jgi:hypothetical protein
MAASSQTHPTAFTKNELGWLDTATIRLHAGVSGNYELQHVVLAQPPVAGRTAAVRIGKDVPYMMIEARKMTDQFEAGMPSLNDGQERGIASEGVIAYRVQTRNPTVQAREGNKKPLFLMTPKALQPSQSATLDNGVTLTVTAARPDGFGIHINDASVHLLDRTATTGARLAAGPPCALVLDGLGIENIAYRDTAGHMNEIWRDLSREGTTDLTANAQATAAQGNPVGWFSANDGFHHVVYRAGNGHLRVAWT